MQRDHLLIRGSSCADSRNRLDAITMEEARGALRADIKRTYGYRQGGRLRRTLNCLRSGRRSRWFESSHPDHSYIKHFPSRSRSPQPVLDRQTWDAYEMARVVRYANRIHSDRAARVEAGVAGDPALDDLAEGECLLALMEKFQPAENT